MVDEVGDDVGEGDVVAGAGAAVLDLDRGGRLVGDAAPDHDDRRDAEELGVLELDAGGGAVAVVEEHSQAGGLEVGGETLAGGELRPVEFSGDHDVHVGRSDLAGPHETEVVVAGFGDRGEAARHTDPVGPHGRRDGLAVLVLHPQLERLGVLAPELEDVADLDAAGDLDRRFADRAHVAVADLGSLDRAVGGEVTTGDEVDHVVARTIGAGDPGGAVDDAGIEEVPDARLLRGSEHTGADVALDECGMGGEVLLGERLRFGRRHLGLESLHVDLAIAGQPDRPTPRPSRRGAAA